MAAQEGLVSGLLNAVVTGDLHEACRVLDQDPTLVHAVRSAEEGPPLTAAAFLGNAAVVDLLLQRGADPQATTSACSTALARAIQSGHVDVVRVLLRHGATP